MNAFWKNTAIPGYTTGFSKRGKKNSINFFEVIFKHIPIVTCHFPGANLAERLWEQSAGTQSFVLWE